MRKRGIPDSKPQLLSLLSAAVSRSSQKYRSSLVSDGMLRKDGKLDLVIYNGLSEDKLRDILMAVRNEVGFDL